MSSQYDLSNVRPSHVAAMLDMADNDPETLAALVANVNRATDDAEVAAYAVVIAPAMWQARRNGAPVRAIVSKAVRVAAASVAMSRWDAYGDMTDAATLEGDGAAVVLSSGAMGAPDARANVTRGDMFETAAAMATPGDGTLAAAGRAYVRLRRQYDDAVAAGERVGRPVSLAGALAMANGWDVADRRYHVSRRATLAGVKRAETTWRAVLALGGDGVGTRATFGGNRVSVGNGFPRHETPVSVIPGRLPRVVPAVTVTRRYGVTTDRRWIGGMAGAGHLLYWDPATGATRWGAVNMSRAAVMRPDADADMSGAVVVCDALGYDARLGYGAPVSRRPGAGWVATREIRETTRTLPAVVVGGSRAMLPPSLVVVGTSLGYDAALGYDAPLTARPLGEDEREAAGTPDAGRVPLVSSGDAPGARPDDAPLGGDVTAAGTVKSHKAPVSPRKRSGGNTGPTVPARLTGAAGKRGKRETPARPSLGKRAPHAANVTAWDDMRDAAN